MIRSVTTTDDAPPAPSPVWFVLVEALIIGAIPLLGVIGFETLLDSRTGTFVVQPGPDEPGWAALVTPSPVTVVVLVNEGGVSGAAVATQPGEGAPGGALVVVPPNLLLDGAALNTLRAEDVPARLSTALDLGVTASMSVSDAEWQALLGSLEVVVDNPDPIPVEEGEEELPIGEVSLAASDLDRFSGRPAEDGPTEAIVVRNQRLWAALLELAADHALAETELGLLLDRIADGETDIEVLPTGPVVGGLAVDDEVAEEMVRRLVAFPTGADQGDRPVVQVLARAQAVDVASTAEELASLGVEVVLIGNADPFDDGATELVLPFDADVTRFDDLAAHLGGGDVVRVAAEESSPAVATLLVAGSASSP